MPPRTPRTTRKRRKTKARRCPRMAAPTPRQVYDERQKETRRLVRVLATLLATYLGLPVTPKTVRDRPKAIFPEVVKCRARQEALARAVHEAAKAAARLP